ncbi:circadian clock-controlled protein daywake [Manduca sexta]|uniref:Uncharacterized protein n=1 Tax=Manduca sexta TaxID=7130 RepID=A0A921ZAC4_MANSE|nr:circadian clock-controlled protein daywake [Manduca sexta]KAG6454231.1 hypothetical protein O3G_MSEX008575 [Manduca sexta]
MFRIILAISLACVCTTNAAVAPFINKCAGEDSKCLKESTQAAIKIFAAGIPSLGVETLDPLKIKSVDASSPNLKLLIKDITGTGLKDCIAKKVQRNKAQSKLFVRLLCTVDFEGQYDMKGKLLVVPIEGMGKAHVVLRKIEITVEADLGEEVGADGVKHWTIKGWKHEYALKDKTTIELENLFGGNEELGRVARELLQSSSNEIVVEIGPPIVKHVASKIIDNVNKFFSFVPQSELEL